MSESSLEFFRLTSEQAKRILAYEDNKCPICGNPLKQPNGEHNHKDGEFRGFTCWKCNKALGLFLDSIERLTKAISYLQNPPARRALGGPHYGNTGRVRKLKPKPSRGHRKVAAQAPDDCSVKRSGALGE